MKKSIVPILATMSAILLVLLCACTSGGGQSGAAGATTATASASQAQALGTGQTERPGQQQSRDSDGGKDANGSGGAASGPATGEVVIDFHYTRQSGAASNQFAVWIEDMDGVMVKTLYATRYTVNGGYSVRPDSIALWVQKSGLAAMAKPEADAITGATPGPGPLSYTWDLTDMDGAAVSSGMYAFFVEGTLRWKNFVLFSGVIRIGDAPDTVQAEAAYAYEASDRNAALTEDSPENGMITDVWARFVPAAEE